MDLIIPLKKSVWEEEIRFSLRSWDKYYSDSINLVIIGDWKPDWFKGNFIHLTGSKSTTEENLGNVLRFILKETNQFIWSNDDIYLLRELGLSDIKKPLYLQDLKSVKVRLNNRWGKLLWKTADDLVSDGLTIYNGECHTPYYYETDLIKEIFDDYQIDLGKGLLRTAYLNNFYEFSEMFKMQDFKLGFYSAIFSDFKNEYYYLNHDDKGLTPQLKNKLKELYPYKSRWEI